MCATKTAVLTQSDPTMPKHVAIVMDGNGRWAKKRFLPRVAGHVRGAEAVRHTIEGCINRGIAYLTIFAFSSENWNRPQEEVGFLMGLFMSTLRKEMARLEANNIKLKVVGDISRFDADLQKLIQLAEERTANNTALTLTVCANYGGQWDILQATRKLLASGITDITSEQISSNLSMSYAPDPDLFIRTGGETRISNFMLWQLAYTEMYFTQTYWPDFNEEELDRAIAAFRSRERRFGQISEQLVVN